jgi:hypothetical protein
LPPDYLTGRASLGSDAVLVRIEESPKRAIRTDYLTPGSVRQPRRRGLLLQLRSQPQRVRDPRGPGERRSRPLQPRARSRELRPRFRRRPAKVLHHPRRDPGSQGPRRDPGSRERPLRLHRAVPEPGEGDRAVSRRLSGFLPLGAGPLHALRRLSEPRPEAIYRGGDGAGSRLQRNAPALAGFARHERGARARDPAPSSRGRRVSRSATPFPRSLRPSRRLRLRVRFDLSRSARDGKKSPWTAPGAALAGSDLGPEAATSSGLA